MSHLANTALNATPHTMDRPFRVLQLNVRRQQGVQLSLLNDGQLRNFGVLAIQEPTIRKCENTLLTTPMHHQNWTKMTPTALSEGRWAASSMLWVNNALEASQIPVPSADITAVLVNLHDRAVIVASIYVKPRDQQVLRQTIQHIQDLSRAALSGRRTDLLFVGDFNLHDQLWGGDEVAPSRQGEADSLVHTMNELALQSLLPRGVKTWRENNHESTIDLTLASEALAEDMITCQIHKTEHGSDHRAIETAFQIQAPEARSSEPRLLFKNAPWNKIQARIAHTLGAMPTGGSVQHQTDQLMKAVLEAVYALTPKAKPSPYAKRWWTADLTKLRKTYTYLRNRARACRRGGQPLQDLERRAKVASKEYHDAIRKQKRAHWEEFLADDTNIWEAARYLQPGHNPFDRVPTLTAADGSAAQNLEEQATELLRTFFPPLPDVCGSEQSKSNRTCVAFPSLTTEEIERQLHGTKPWKAPGEDGLPAAVWKHIWPAVRERVVTLFQASVDNGQVPVQWTHAKIIPLKKPNKGDYTKAKAWRPISLLSTLGKLLEATLAERISHLVETHGLLPANHFGARKGKSTEQALTLLQERVYQAWRSRRVVSLVSFDVKGAYNGVCKERLLQRLAARRIPPQLTKWVDAFCSNRTATLVVNGQATAKQALIQAGLPQGSPLSPILFLFYNADLVQHPINNSEGAIAFMDDYSAWVTGESASANRQKLEGQIDRAMKWAHRSGATFETDKTTIIHFTRNPKKTDESPYTIKGTSIYPVGQVKLLGVIMDAKLRFRQHIARAATRGLRAAMALRRLRLLSPVTARQLFTATVAPVVDYASVVWSHACRKSDLSEMNRVQKVGAQAITGAFRTVATAVLEAEAGIRTVDARHCRKALKFWIDIHTLQPSHPLANLKTKQYRRFRSPLQQLAYKHQHIPIDRMEKVSPYLLSPDERRIEAIIHPDRVVAAEAVANTSGIIIATSCSQRNGLVGMGGAICPRVNGSGSKPVTYYSVTITTDEEQNAYTAELHAIAMALKCMPQTVRDMQLVVCSANQSALRAISQPRQQSGQTSIGIIYEARQRLEVRNNRVICMWLPATEDSPLAQRAKAAAKAATAHGRRPQVKTYQAKSTALNKAMSAAAEEHRLPPHVGRHSREVDVALPGKHTTKLYNQLKKDEASILAQLRTGATRLNSYLHKIGRAESDLCPCGSASETIKHFLFRCSLWNQQRLQLFKDTRPRNGNLSYCVGGKTPADSPEWAPDMKAVRATINFARATGRLQQQQLT